MKARRHVLLLRGWYWNQLPLVKVILLGDDYRDFCVHRAEAPSDWLHFDFEPDVRELVTESIQYDRVAMWADPCERLGITPKATYWPAGAISVWGRGSTSRGRTSRRHARQEAVLEAEQGRVRDDVALRKCSL